MTTRNYIEEYEYLQKTDMDYEIYKSKMKDLSKEIELYLEWNFTYEDYQTEEYCRLYDICKKSYTIAIKN